MKLTPSLLALGLLGWTLATSAQTSTPEVVVPVGGTVTIPAPGFQKSQVLLPDKADFEIQPDGIRVRGKEVGQTKVVVWDQQGHTHSYMISVVTAGEVDRQRERSAQAALADDPTTRDAGIQVTVEGDSATLTGTVANQAVADRAVAVLQPRLPRITSRLQIGGGRPSAAPVRPAANVDLPPVAAPGSGRRPAGPLPGLPTLDVRLDDIRDAGSLELTVGEARLVSVPTEVKRALLAEPNIADVVLIPPREVAIIAKQPGDTTLMLWYIGADAFLGQTDKTQVKVHVVGPPTTKGPPGNFPSPEEIDHVLSLLGITGVQVATHYEGTTATVLLMGKVPSAMHRQRAEQAVVALFPTTTRVTNLIEVARPATLTGGALAAQEKRLEKLLADELPNASIRVRLRPEGDGDALRVLLSGQAPLPADRLKAEQLVQFDLGPQALATNNIVTPLPPVPEELLAGPGGKDATQPKPDRPPLAQALLQAIEASGVAHDRVFVDVLEQPKKRVLLRGSVRSDDDQADLMEAVQDVLDQYGGDYELRDRGLSVRPARVVTEVQIVELSANDTRNLGVAYGVPTGGSASGGSGGGSATGSTSVTNTNGQLTIYGERTSGGHIGRIDPLAATIQALVTKNRARVLSQPNITSNDNQQGTVEIVTEVPLPSTTTGTGGTTGSSVEFKPVGIRLLVTPRISWAEPTNQIEMTIQTEVSAVDFGISINIGGSVIPGITNRQTVTVVTVDDGETLAIGGLTTESENKNVSKLPFLSDIPLIGELFKNTTNSKSQTTVVVVMTPRIKW